MNNFNASEVEASLNSAVDARVRLLADNYARILKSYIDYEYVIANEELASSWKRHGYNFKMMPESFVNGIIIHPVVTNGNRYSVEVSLSASSFQNEPQSKIDFFRTYVLGNALSKLKSRHD